MRPKGRSREKKNKLVAFFIPTHRKDTRQFLRKVPPIFISSCRTLATVNQCRLCSQWRVLMSFHLLPIPRAPRRSHPGRATTQMKSKDLASGHFLTRLAARRRTTQQICKTLAIRSRMAVVGDVLTQAAHRRQSLRVAAICANISGGIRNLYFAVMKIVRSRPMEGFRARRIEIATKPNINQVFLVTGKVATDFSAEWTT